MESSVSIFVKFVSPLGGMRHRFTQEVDGRKVEYRNWTITIDGKTIPIEKTKSEITIERKGGKVDIFVNGQQVHDE